MAQNDDLKAGDVVHVTGQNHRMAVICDTSAGGSVDLWSDVHGRVRLPMAILVAICVADDCATRYPAWRSGWCRKCDFMAREQERHRKQYPAPCERPDLCGADCDTCRASRAPVATP